MQFIRLEGYWNDLGCDKPLPYICKKPQQLLPKLDDSNLPVEEGCDPGWKAYGKKLTFFLFNYFMKRHIKKCSKIANLN